MGSGLHIERIGLVLSPEMMAGLNQLDLTPTWFRFDLEYLMEGLKVSGGLDFLAEKGGLRNSASSNPEGIFIQSERPIYWLLEENGKYLFFTFEDRMRPETAKLYRYSAEKLSGGVNLKEDTPVYTGVAAVQVLMESRFISF